MSSRPTISAARGGVIAGSENSTSQTTVAALRRQPLALRPLRLVLLACGLIAFLLGLWTGMARLGVGLMGAAPRFVEFHGVLMICGFFGTLISVERAVALNRPMAYMIPIFAAAGTLALLARTITLAGAAFLIASLVLAAASFRNMRRLQSVLLAAIPSIAALCWGLGTLTWLTDRPLPEATGWWLAFLVLTVAAERLELSRVVAPPAMARLIFAAAITVLLIGVGRGELERPISPFMGSGLILCGAWLLIYDLARRTVRLSGQIRFTALCMLLGYGWLIIAGLELFARPIAAFWYDAVVHAVTLGFVLSMVFGHTLIIFPSVVGLTLRYSAVLYVPLLLLQISVIIRTIGDFSGSIEIRSVSGFLAIIALACFAATIVVASVCNPSDAQAFHSKANPDRGGESMASRVLLPEGWADPIGYANGIETTPGKIVFVAGQVGWDADQKFKSEELVPQFEQALQNVLQVLAEAGGRPDHICRITAFCTDKRAYLDGRRELGRIWRRLMGRHYPAMTLTFVVDLLDHPAKIELEATAVIPIAE